MVNLRAMGLCLPKAFEFGIGIWLVDSEVSRESFDPKKNENSLSTLQSADVFTDHLDCTIGDKLLSKSLWKVSRNIDLV